MQDAVARKAPVSVPKDCIRIVELEIFANHGVFPEETALWPLRAAATIWLIPSTTAQYATWPTG